MSSNVTKESCLQTSQNKSLATPNTISSAHRYHPCADSEAEKTSTRCPVKCAISQLLLFTLQAHHAANPDLQRRRTTQLWAAIGKPAGARSVYRGHWCMMSRRHPGRQLCTTTWELPSSVGRGIAWTQTSDLQAIGHILHSTRSAFTGCTTREPHYSAF
ncbi:UNVERIFIED_CONTAM: hypothetical protein FKN15_033542 [Acipenser sinensis]